MVLDVLILGNQSVEFHVTPVCCIATSCSHYVLYDGRKLFLVNTNFMVKLSWYFCVCSNKCNSGIISREGFLDIKRRPQKWFLCHPGFQRTPKPPRHQDPAARICTKYRIYLALPTDWYTILHPFIASFIRHWLRVPTVCHILKIQVLLHSGHGAYKRAGKRDIQKSINMLTI